MASLWLREVQPHWSEAVFFPWLSQLQGFVSVRFDAASGVGAIDFSSVAASEAALPMLYGAPNPQDGAPLLPQRAGAPQPGGQQGQQQQQYQQQPQQQQYGAPQGGQVGGGRAAPPPGGGDFSCFVGGLGPDTDEAELRQLFTSRYPSVFNARIVKDFDTGRPKGFGFIRFSSQAEQQAAVAEMTGVLAGGQPIRVSEANSRGGAMGGGGGGGGAPVVPLSTSGLPYGPPPAESEGITTIFCGGIAPTVTEADVYSLFSPIGPLSSISLPPGRGLAFVQYQYRAHTDEALRTLVGHVLHGQPMRPSLGKQQSRQGGGGGPPLGGGAAYAPSQGRAPVAMAGGRSSGWGVATGPAPMGAAPAPPPAQPVHLGGLFAAAAAGLGLGGAALEGGAGAGGEEAQPSSWTLPSDVRAAFEHPSVGDTGVPTRHFRSDAANEAFALTAAAMAYTPMPLLVPTVEGPESGSVVTAQKK